MDNPNAEKNKIIWEADEFEYHPKTATWYIGFTVVASALIIFGVLSKSILTIGLFVLMVFLGFIYAHRKPRTIKHQLLSDGVGQNETLYPYKNIKKFWLVYNPPIKILYLETNSVVMPVISMQLGHQDPVAVKNYLKQYLTEDLERPESLVDILARNLRI